ncbi:Threonine/homoserine/homoserine lactone efflux protein [Palleronia salina]|uniref:Threonine/homoserine/homoserine lactone efflux protein n=1 Tax=Palleronia salina TaxID=313368 RepID=A0A1M6AGX8_9RHOB|nr:LysE family translocator [Palleronia salina]SHI35790.1 Threonine/homoserine/homoserine lactone efflux protein [Palleronia salina]
MSLLAFLGVALAHLLAAISPGPSFVLSLRTAIGEGFRPAAGLALGFGIGAMLWATAALAGLALVFEILPPVFVALKVLGGLFLVWLGITMWRHAPAPMPKVDAGQAPRGTLAAIRLGVAAMLANPKPAIFFGAVFVGLVPATAGALDKALVLFNILWVETAWYLLVAWAFSQPRARAAYGRAKTALDRGFGGLLAALGAKVALS